MTESVDRRPPVQAIDSMIPVIPSTLSAHDRGRWIDFAVRVLSEYPVLREFAMPREYRRRLAREQGVIRINTSRGYAYPKFQFEEGERVRWLIRVSARRLPDELALGEWWTTSSEGLPDKSRPASLLGTPRESEELRDLVMSLQSN